MWRVTPLLQVKNKYLLRNNPAQAIRISFILLLSSCFFFFACSKKPDTVSSSDETGEKAKTAITQVVVGSIGDASRLIPIMASDSASGTISSLVFNGLVKYDNNLNLVGDLAESFTVSDDCLEVNFKLREGVKWHDGKSFTAKDVAFTYSKLIDPNVATPYKGDFEMVDKLEILDDFRIRVTYKKPFAPAVASWGMGMVPRHLLENEDFNTTAFNRNPVGTGPYKMKNWETGAKIVLTSNKDYFEKIPGIDRYIYRIIPDTATMFLELKTLNLDYMDLDPLQYKRQTSGGLFEKKFRKYRYPAFSYTYLGYNLKDKRFAKKEIRQALTYAIDKGAIIEGVLLGLGRPATGPFPPESWAYNQSVQQFSYNPAKAVKMLKKEGWVDTDGDGVIDKDGIPFAFSILTNQGNSKRAKAAEIIQQNLKKVGIDVSIRILEWQTLLHQFIDKKKFDAIIIGWALGRDPDAYDIWHSSKVGEGEFNFISYSNQRVDELLVSGRQTCNREKREKIYNLIHALIAEDQPYTFLYYPDSLPILEKRFRGVKPGPLGIWYNLADWSVPRDRNAWYQ